MDKLASWTEAEDEGVNYYSGSTAGAFQITVNENGEPVSKETIRNGSNSASVRFQSGGGALKLNFRTETPPGAL